MSSIRLPSYPKLAQEFREALTIHIHKLIRREGLAGQLDSHIIQEGRSSAIQRSNSTDAEATQMFHASHEMNFTFEEIETVTLDKVMSKISELADSFRAQQARRLYETMQEITEKTGQIVDGQGRPLDADMIFEALDQLPPMYDPSTGQSDTVLVVHPDMMERLKEIDRQIRTTPELAQRFNELERRKRDEFRKAEMDRQLVG